MKALLSRRRFLKGLSAVAAITYANVFYGVRVAEAKGNRRKRGRLKAYIRSGRDISGLSRASLKHCHRFIYATRLAARKSTAHPNDYAEVKSVYITRKNYIDLFLKNRTKQAYVSDLKSII